MPPADDPPSLPNWQPPAPEWFRVTLSELKRALEAGEVTSLELVEAHLERIEEVDHGVRAFVELLPEEARAAAQTRDDERRAGRVRGGLHGIPFCIAECFEVADRATTLGLPSRRGERARVDSAMLRALREAGAVLLGRTNVAQLALGLESDNPLYGRTNNPFNARHSAGGSSGGAAAALAAGLAPLAVGADLAGSVRIAAHFCGVAGFRPTPSRLPNAGILAHEPRQRAIPIQAGLLARSIEDVALTFGALGAEALHTLDERVPPAIDVPAPRLSEMRVGVYLDDGLLAPSSALIAAVERAADALRAAGATIVQFEPPELSELFFDAAELLSPDGGKSLLDALGNDPVAEALRPAVQLARLPQPVRSTMARMASLTGDPDLSRLLATLREKTAGELLQIEARLERRAQNLLDAIRQAELDVVLCPAFATPALPHGTSNDMFLASSYSLAWNAAGFSSGVVPVTRVHATEARRDRARGKTGRGARRIDEQSAGLPMGAQVGAGPWADECVLAALAAIERNVRNDVDFPRTPIP